MLNLYIWLNRGDLLISPRKIVVLPDYTGRYSLSVLTHITSVFSTSPSSFSYPEMKGSEGQESAFIFTMETLTFTYSFSANVPSSIPSWRIDDDTEWEQRK